MEKETREIEIYAKELQEEGRKLFFENRISSAIEITRRAADAFDGIEERHSQAVCLNSIGVFYDALGNYDLSGTYYLKALEIAQEYGLNDVLALIYNNMGSEFQDFHNSERARECFDLSMQALPPEQYPEGKKDLSIIINMNLSESYAKLGEMDKALEYLDRARSFTDIAETEQERFSFKAFESRILWESGREDYVRAHIEELVEVALSYVNVVDFKENIQDVCETLFLAKDYGHLRQVIEHCEESCTEDNIILKLATLDLWIRYYKEIGDEDSYREKCVEYYRTVKQKEEQECAARSDSLITKLDLRKAEKEREQVDTNAKIDPLTGVGNRACMLEESREIIERSIENRTMIGICLMDIDFFKECNDTYGHIRGDECLQQIAAALQKTVGEAGSVYRFGGDEFLLLLEDTTEEALLDLGQRIKDEIAALAFINEASPISPCVTVSQGYTLAGAEEGDSIEYLVDLADRVLYQVKRMGKNDFRYMRLQDILADLH